VKENRPRVFKNRALRKMFRIERDEVTGDWRKLHNEEQHDLNCCPDIWVIRSRRLRRNIHLEFGSKTNGKRSF